MVSWGFVTRLLHAYQVDLGNPCYSVAGFGCTGQQRLSYGGNLVKFTRTVGILMLVCFVLGTNARVSRAQEGVIAQTDGTSNNGTVELEDVVVAPKPELSDEEIAALLEKKPENVTESDLTLLAHIIFQEKITAEQLFAFHDKLSPEQQKFVQTTFLAIAPEYLGQYVEPKPTPETPQEPSPDAVSACDPGAAPYCWKQFIEEDNNNPMNKVGPRNYYTNQYSCDTQDDTDYIFYFSFNASNPNAIRFTVSTSAHVAYVLSFAALPSGYSSYGYNNSEVRFCIGDNTVWTAGGAANIMGHLKIYNR